MSLHKSWGGYKSPDSEKTNRQSKLKWKRHEMPHKRQEKHMMAIKNCALFEKTSSLSASFLFLDAPSWMEVQIVDLDNSLQCEHSSIRFSKKPSVQNEENASQFTSEVLVQVILTTKASEKWNACFLFFFLHPSQQVLFMIWTSWIQVEAPASLSSSWFGGCGRCWCKL